MSDPDFPLEYVHVDPRTESEGAAPAVFVLHGRGADEEDLLPVARRLPDDLHVFSLRAPDRLMGGYTWYELDLSGGGLHASEPVDEEFRRSLDAVGEFVDAAVDRWNLDAGRLGLLGFSQGAITSLSLLVERPDRFAWVVALHGYLAASHAGRDVDLRGTPVFVGAGTRDEVIPADRATTAVDRLRELGADVTSETYDVGHGIAPDELADVVAFVERVT